MHFFQAGLSARLETEGETVAGQTPTGRRVRKQGNEGFASHGIAKREMAFPFAFFKKNGKKYLVVGDKCGIPKKWLIIEICLSKPKKERRL